MELRAIDVDALDLGLGRLRMLPETVVARMAESLRRQGQLSPLVAARHAGQPVLVDGFVRRAAAVRIGLRQVQVELVELSDVQMKAQIYLRNRERGLLLLEECRLVHELNRADGLNQVEIGDLLERHKSWVCRRLSLYRSLSANLRDDGALEQLGAGSIRRLALLPHRNQEQLVAVACRERLAPRAAAQFVDLWRRATGPDARRYVLEHPREALSTARSTRRTASADPRVGEAGRYVVEGMVALEQVCLRLVRRLGSGVEDLNADGRASVEGVMERAEERCAQVFDEVRQWLLRTGGVDEREEPEAP